jgi:two-component system CheB/CheR fusion protein
LSLDAGPDFEALLEYLRRDRGFDFTGYKRTTLIRRVSKRVTQLGIDNFASYLDYLQVHADEFSILFNSILINLTEFFRDRPAWDHVRDTIVPQIIAKPASQPIRVWSAGCSSGEEAYSIAMLLADALGEEAFVQRVKIYATDVDEDALGTARNGYTEKAVEPLGEELTGKYFESQGGRFAFKAALRRAMIFGRHDLIQDAPISRLDLLICRNVLIYFTAESQAGVLNRFQYALNEKGFLFLGRSEMLLTRGDLFVPVAIKHRIFGKLAAPPDRVLPAGQLGGGKAEEARPIRLRDLADDLAPLGQLVVDAKGNLIAANQLARAQLGINLSDVGRPFRDLDASYRPVELRSQVSRATQERQPVSLPSVEYRQPDGTLKHYRVLLAPVLFNSSVLGTTITFEDVTESVILKQELERAREGVETVHEELQSANEELETTNEELQSTVEELETTNEELQSTNEELETMNEELESTNSELQTINADLRQQTDEVERLNTFTQAVMESFGVGIAVIGKDLRVVAWNEPAHDLWGLRQDEAIGQNIYELDIGLQLDEFKAMIERVATGREDGPRTETVRAINRRGRSIHCQVTIKPLGSPVPGGVVVLMEDVTKVSST